MLFSRALVVALPHSPVPASLQVVSTILASTTRLIANKAAWQDPAKRTKIEDVALLLQARLGLCVAAGVCLFF